VYDMYAWDQPASSADEHAEPAAAPGDTGRAASGAQVTYAHHASRADHPAPAVRAVQVALDRRDNGGDPGPGRVG
jgi:hypothetical protein